MENSTIAAIATPLSTGGVGVLRISGRGSLKILLHVFRPFQPARQTGKETSRVTLSAENIASHRFYHGYIVDNDQLIDEVLVVFMRAPRSYTGEDVAEIHAHGGPYVLQAVLQRVIKSGARLAAPGEFTRRAFINGKMDLTQAEAVADLIMARSEKALHLAANQMAGDMNREIRTITNQLFDMLARIEASIDFSDQTDEQAPLETIRKALDQDVSARLERLIDRYTNYSWVRSGVSVVLAGRPNVGKSTLLNTILGRERSIVSDVPGTTRDFIEEAILLSGLSFVFTDTAGLRNRSGDNVEGIGMKRTKEMISKADMVVFMVDAAAGVSAEDRELLSALRHNQVLVVGNKSDLSEAAGFVFPPEWAAAFPVLQISALTGMGIDRFKEKLIEHFTLRLPQATEKELIPNPRHKDALEKALKAVLTALAAIDRHVPEDLIAMDLREAINRLNEITGQTAGADVLDSIFSRFCIGK